MIINQEKDVQYALADLDITYIRELSINKLHKYYHTAINNQLKAKRFDYYLPKLRTVIEFDGSQHFTPIDYFGGMDQFMSTVTTDFEKMNYCFDNNIKVIRLTQGTNSDFLAQAINDREHNLITIKDNQLENQSIDRFELPESFNVHIENQVLKTEMNQLTSHYESKIDQLNDTITELQDEVEFLKKPQIDDQIIDSLMIIYMEFLEDQGILNLPYLSASTEYKRYVEWLKLMNSLATPMKSKKFTIEFEKKLTSKNFIRLKKRVTPKSLSKLDYNNNVINIISDIEIEEKSRTVSYFFYNKHNVIKEPKYSNDISLDLDDPIDLQKYYYLVEELGDVYVLSKYGESLMY